MGARDRQLSSDRDGHRADQVVGATRFDPSGLEIDTLVEQQEEVPMVTPLSLRLILCPAAPVNVSLAF